MADSSKPSQIAPKIAFSDPNFTFRFPKTHKNPGMGAWMGSHIWGWLPFREIFYCFVKESIALIIIFEIIIIETPKSDYVHGRPLLLP